MSKEVESLVHDLAERRRDLMGLREVAAILGVEPGHVGVMRRRGKLPEPIVTLACGPIWDGNSIRATAKRRIDAKRRMVSIAELVLPDAHDQFAE